MMPRHSMFGLEGKVVIVTGGAAGIGRVYGDHLVQAGAHVVVADVDGAAAEQAARAMSSKGKAVGVRCDVSDAESVDAMTAAAIEEFGRIDGLVNNAALMSSLPRSRWHDIPAEDWDRVMAVNLRGMFLTCRAAYPHMKRQGGGKIVNVSSNRFFDGTPNRLHYSTSKAGVIGFTRSLAREVGDDHICVNAITPGFTLSDSQATSSNADYIARMAALNERKAIKRTQRPEDLVGTVLFLLSSASDYITGQTINVDGGFVMH